ncbi:MAG: M1 family aminopeptidase [Gemmatimonadota bacterium]
MNRLVRIAAGLAALFVAVPLAAQQRPTGIVGQYVPPRVWPQGKHDYDLVHQKIAVQFDMAKRLVTGRVTTTVVPSERTDTVRLNALYITIDGATDAQGRRLRFVSDTDHVTVRLRRRVPAGDTVVFTLAYHTHPERGIYFVPRRHVIWSQGEAVETRAWVPTYDHPNDKETWEMLVTAAVDHGARSVWHWSQGEKASTYLMSVVVGPFTVLHDHWRDKQVDEWVYPDTVDAGWRTAGETPSMIELYSELLDVPFPWDKYDQSWIPDFTYGGMENASATTQTDLDLAGPGNPPGAGRGLVAHELAHQWFGDLETTANWANAWLNEGFATYMESVQNEKSRGWDAAQLEWWGQQQQAMRADLRQARPLVWGKYSGNDPIVLFFTGHIYPKGAQVLHQLRRLLGDRVFWAGMHRFLVDNAHKPVTTPDLAVAFEKTCGCDLDWFFDQWAYGIGYPKLNVSRSWDPASKVLSVKVDQVQKTDSVRPLFRFPTTIRVITADSVMRDSVMVQAQKSQTFRIQLPGKPLSFRFDEGGWLLGEVHTDQTPAELAYMAEHDLDTSARNWALRGLADSRDSVAVAARRFIVLNEHEAPLRVVALRQMVHDSTPEGMRVVRSALRDPDASVRAQALVTLYTLAPEGVGDTALAMYQSDPEVGVRAAALNVYAHADGTTAVPTLLAATKSGHPLSVRMTAANALGQLKDARAADALAQLTDPVEVRGLRQVGLMSLLALGDTTRTLQVAGKALGDYDPLFATAAARVLGRLGTPAARSALEAAEKSESRVRVKAVIEQALQGRSGRRRRGGR